MGTNNQINHHSTAQSLKLLLRINHTNTKNVFFKEEKEQQEEKEEEEKDRNQDRKVRPSNLLHRGPPVIRLLRSRTLDSNIIFDRNISDSKLILRDGVVRGVAECCSGVWRGRRA